MTTTKRTIGIESGIQYTSDCRYVRSANCHGHIVPTLGGEYVAIDHPDATHGIIVSLPTAAALEDAYYGDGERVEVARRARK
jgi:hypothetical protein